MKSRFALTATIVALFFASQASASVISASSQTARTKAADRVDYLSVTTIQNGLNASLREAADASAPTALAGPSAPSSSGGFLLTTEPGSASSYGSPGGSAMEHLFNPDSERGVSAISRGVAPGTIVAGNSGNGHGNRHGDKIRDADKDKDKDKGKKDGKGGGGVHATPEPSTWLLLGAGLTMVGLYEVIRRRA